MPPRSLLDASNAPATDKRSWGTPDPVANPTKVTQYDGLDRLLKVYNPNWGTPPTGVHNAVYTCDPLDNLRSNRLGASELTYSYNAQNQLASLSYNNGAAQAVTTNARGDITANAYRGQAYQFDLSHRLSEVSGKEGYLYDGNGRRARTLNLQTGTIEYFGYSLDGRLMQDWSNRRQVRNGYVYLGNTLVGLYEVNITNGAINPRYKHTDALGSPVVTTDAGKNVMSRMAYTPYGAPTAPMDGVGYTGHFIDVGTQLTYMQQRYYDPQVARFLSKDPVPTEPSSGANFNSYAYAMLNPYRFVDPDGRYACEGSRCKQLDEAIEATRAKIEAMESSDTKTALTEIMDAIGTNGDGQGPNYQTDEKRASSAAHFDQDTGKTTVHIPKGSPESKTGSSVVHEYSHQRDNSGRGRAATTKAEIVDTETRAYGYTRDVLSLYGVAVKPDALQKAINDSVKRDIKAIESAMKASGVKDFEIK